MKNNFINNALLGKNTWWRYVLSLFVPVLVIILLNIVIGQILPSLKSAFPDDDFGKELGTFSIVFLVFGMALLAFTVAASKLHKRPIVSFINIDANFSWKYYFLGFILWGGLLFIGALISDFGTFKTFLQNFDSTQFLILLLVGFIAIGVQSFFEEIVIRGYFLQGLHLRIKNIAVLVGINALIFGVLHFGYGLESFLSSWLFGVAFAIIVILQNRIEFVSGAHNANNLLLALIFVDLSEATNEAFNWSINWAEFSLHFIALLLLVGLVYKFFRKLQ